VTVVGEGGSGIQTSFDPAVAGFAVYRVEKAPVLGDRR
jgi:heterodisulfide reductase subunit A-like polyferredoxin